MFETHTNDILWYQEKSLDYEELAVRMADILEEILFIEKANYAIIEERVKSMDSFKNRLKEINYSGKELVDLAGIRVVGYVRTDVDKILQIIRANFDVDETRSKDKSAELSPDRFGYRAVHIVCKLPTTRITLPEYRKFKDMFFEIQVKTILEHAWAVIEHDRNYKYKGLSDEIKRDFYLTSGLLENADKQFDQITKRIEKYDKEIKQKTSQGKLEEIILDPRTLKQYLIEKFSNKIENLENSYGYDGTGEIEVKELASFGISNLSQLEKIMHSQLAAIRNTFQNSKPVFSERANLSAVVFTILIIQFKEKYRESAIKIRGINPSTFDEYLAAYKKAITTVEK